MFSVTRATRKRPSRRPGRRTDPAAAGSLSLSLEPLEERALLTANPLDAALAAVFGPDGVGKDGPMASIGFELALLYEQYTQGQSLQAGTAYSAPASAQLARSADSIGLQLSGTGDVTAFRNQLVALGMTDVTVAGSLVDGRLPISKLAQLASLDTLRMVRPAYLPITAAGLVDSQADAALHADDARSLFGVDGTGVAVGVLSDSFNALGGMAADIQSDDLPQDTQVLQDAPFGTDEGRGMAQHIHDLAPGASILFATANGGESNFANNILALAAAGANVITDDIRYFSEPFFQDGVVAQAAQSVVAQGIPFFSAAFNEGVRSYEGAFVDSGETTTGGAKLHDFDPGAGVATLQEIRLPVGGQINFSFQWDQPFGSLGGAGATSDLDISLIGADGTTVVASSMNNNIGGDPLEILSAVNDGSFDLDGDNQPDTKFFVQISLAAGSAPGLIKYVDYGRSSTIIGFATDSSTSVGHANTAGVLGVAASAFLATPEFGIDPPLLDDYSSRGGTAILFDTSGQRLQTPFNPNAPQVTGVDGGNTTFFGDDIPQDSDSYPNFFGTSAAAPHLAAVAALMIQVSGGPGAVAPDDIYKAMEDTAIDIVARVNISTLNVTPIPNGVGFDTFSGYGLVDAVAALQAINSKVALGDDVAKLEGNSGITNFVFTVNYTGNAIQAVTVAYATVAGTATAGIDYLGASGTITFISGGPKTQYVTVGVVADEEVEPNETFFLQLSDPVNAILGRSQAQGTILNDDVDLSINDASIIEGHTGNRNLVFTVSAFGDVNQVISVSYLTVNNTAQGATDYLPQAGVINLPPGATSAKITVPVVGDHLDEDDETFYVVLTSPHGARIVDGTGVGTIIDDDLSPNLYVSDAFITTTLAGQTSAVFTVGLDVPSGRNVSVNYSTADGSAADGTEYAGQAGNLVFAPGVTTIQVSVPVYTASVYSSNKKFYLDLAGATNAGMYDPEGAATIIYAAAPVGEKIVDNGAAGYAETGTWTNLTNTLAYNLDYDYASAGTGNATATWSFTAIPNGSYQVFARWIPFSNRATNAPFTILNNQTPLSTVVVNQQLAPTGDFSNGVTWQSLGTFDTTTNTLRVRLTNNANGYVVADAIRIVANGIPAAVPEIDVSDFDHSIDTADMTPAIEDGTDFGSVPSLGVVVSHTFTITNTGSAPLHLTGSPVVSIGGPNAADFTVVKQPATTVAPGGHTTFQLDFRATGTGIRTGVVSIASDDGDEPAYTFFVRGTLDSPVAVPLAHNAALPQDVNGDTRVTPNDMLVVINAMLHDAQAQPLAAEVVPAEVLPKYSVDVNADGRLTPRDLLMVINYLLASSAAPSAAPSAQEAEPLAAPVVDHALVLFDDTETRLVEPAAALDPVLLNDESPAGVPVAGAPLLVTDDDIPQLVVSDPAVDDDDAPSASAVWDG